MNKVETMVKEVNVLDKNKDGEWIPNWLREEEYEF